MAAKAKKSRKTGRKSKDGQLFSDEGNIEYVHLSQETRRRYLNYALSVITSRALPDVRDGLKPVQRRILFTMFSDLRLLADSKTRKSASIAGNTTANYHPHGEVAVYDALVRMAQDFTLRHPLVNGQGNFGSVIGLPAASARYTEARLTQIAEELMQELRYETVDMRPNYEANREEPVVLPARFPNLLVNGTQGIAVGMATNIPPHNLGEVIKACVHLIKNNNATVAQLMKYIKGPDFPLGGRIVSDRKTIRQAYETGRGAIKVRGEWKLERPSRAKKGGNTFAVIYSVPYGVNTGPLLSDIGEIVAERKLPQLIDVHDETDDENGLRIVLEIKEGTAPESVFAYLFKNTALEQNFSLNTTCLVPDERGTVVPAHASLTELLQYFLEFRVTTVRKRFEYQLRQLEKRIHILEGFEIVFSGIEKALRIIRQSKGKTDAAKKLMRAFPLDEIQTYAILEMQLYRISQLEIDNIPEELAEKRAEADNIRKILKSERRLWTIVQKELEAVSAEYADKRRTSIGSPEEIEEFDPQEYIVRENTNVVVTCEGWIKRVGKIQKVESTRVREGDEVLNVLPGSTLDHTIFFSSDGVAYTLPIDQIPVSSGYGAPLSKFVRMGDGANIVEGMTTDVRFMPEDKNKRGVATPLPHVLIVTALGQVMKISLSGFRTASTKAGRKYCRLRQGDRVVYVGLIDDATTMFIATKKARVIHFAIEDVPLLNSAGKGVRGIKLEGNDKAIGAAQLSRPSDCLRVVNSNDKTLSFGQMKYGVTSRGGKGVKTSHRNGFKKVILPDIDLIDWTTYD